MQTPRFRQLVPNELLAPPELRNFLVQLETTTTTDDVWAALVTLSTGLGLPVVDYVCATDFRNWEQAQFIRTTLHSDWINQASQNPNIRRSSYFRTHAVTRLTPILIGWEYRNLMGDLSPERLEILKMTAEMGMSAGMAVPLRMGEPGQAGILAFGGQLRRAECDVLLEENGWTLHSAALSAHTRYIELFKREFINRNELTPKQRELITFVGQGMMDKQIAHELGISFSAVRQRLVSVQAKTGVRNRAELAALAMRIGLVPDPMLRTSASDLTVFLSTGDGKTGSEMRPPLED